MTTTTEATVPPMTATAPVGLRVSEKLLATYRQLQDRYADPHLDRLGRDRVAEKLASRILQATDCYPWTPPEIYYWTWAWLHVLAYGEEAWGRKRFQPYYGPMHRKRGFIPAWDGVDWVVKYPDIEDIVAEMDDDDRKRHRGVS